MDLNLLKGLLNEIYSEVYVEDVLQRENKEDTGYNREIDIHDYEGFSNWVAVTDHESIQK